MTEIRPKTTLPPLAKSARKAGDEAAEKTTLFLQLLIIGWQ
jgi:hypothetical protein